MNLHEVTQIADRTWHIGENQRTSVYLLTGTREALLIDTGMGLGDLPAVVRSLTDLPVRVVLTHIHFDHVGGIGWFSDVCVHPADLPAAAMIRTEQIAGGIREFFPNQTYENKPVSRNVHFHTVQEGDRFDLGGRIVRVLDTPGHTIGSISLLDEQTGFLFSGDACNHNLLLSIPRSYEPYMAPGTCFASLEICKKTLEKIRDLEYTQNYTGHFDEIGQQPAHPDTARDLIWICEEVLAGRRQSGTPMLVDYTEDQFQCMTHGSATLSFDPNRLHESWITR